MAKNTIPNRQGRIQTVCDAPDDILLVGASYEDRATGVAGLLSPKYSCRTGLIYVNREFLTGVAGKTTRRNLQSLRKALQTHCGAVYEETGSWLDAKQQLESLRRLIHKAGQALDRGRKLVVSADITTFTRESLIVACALLKNQLPISRFRILYAVPKTHGDWLSRGFRMVRNIMGFAGTQLPALPTVLLILSGFEPERTSRVIEEHEPSKVLLGIGNPPTVKSFLDRNIKEQQQLILARQDVERFDFPADSVVACASRLEKIIAKYLGANNIIIAPMSTKVSTLAAMLVAERHSDIQLTYCLPGEYNVNSYSKGVKTVLSEELPL
jgi:hypothetical protein